MLSDSPSEISTPGFASEKNIHDLFKRLTEDVHSNRDVRKFYFKLINDEFRKLQLDPKLKNKSLFDLLDYCELLYEELWQVSSTESGLRSYIRGYLIYNYFINSLIRMHFGGFDEFIRCNEPDFIIYLNLFAFYNVNKTMKEDLHDVPLKDIRKWILQYLSEKNLMEFDVRELYGWLYEYMLYLKQRDEYDAAEDDQAEADFDADDGVNGENEGDFDFKKPMAISGSQVGHKKGNNNQDQVSFASSDESYEDFVTRFPSLSHKGVNGSTNGTSAVNLIKLTQVSDSPRISQFSKSVESFAEVQPKYSKPSSRLSMPPLSLSEASAVESYIANHHDVNGLESTTTSAPAHDRSIKNQAPYPVEASEELEKVVMKSGDNIDKRYNQDFNIKQSTAPVPGERAINSQTALQRPKMEVGEAYRLYPQALPQYYPNQSNYPVPNTMPHMPPMPPIPPPRQYVYTQPQGPPMAYPSGNVPLTNHGHPTMTPPMAVGNPSNQHYQPYQVKRKEDMYLNSYSICGLKNFGSSCYINSTVQLLFGLNRFKEIFQDMKYLKFIKNPRYAKLLSYKGTSKDTVLLCEAMASLLRSFQAHSGSSIAPTKFLRVTSLLKPDFNIPNEQQDSQEFLLFLIERLHDELSYKVPQSSEISRLDLERYVIKWNININIKDKNDYLDWYESVIKNEGTSPIHDLFQGHLQNKLICNKCGHESINYSPFTILSLPIPANNFDGRVDLSDCLKYYTQDEVLTGDNAWKCPKCTEREDNLAPSVLDNHPVFMNKKSGIFRLGRRSKSPSKANNRKQAPPAHNSISIKSLNFIKLPQILFVHLSRFSMFSLSDKLSTVIKYPLELRFNNYSNNINHQIVYKLVGLINHYGTLKSGHYTALVDKAPSRKPTNPYWCYFDDESVKIDLRHGDASRPDLDYQELNSRDVYVLCYERV